MNIPNQIRIGSCDYQIKLTPNNLVLNGKECCATINYHNHEIEINTNCKDKQFNEISFLHEVFHGIVRDRNLNIDDEELIVEELARGLHQVIRDNPSMFH